MAKFWQKGSLSSPSSSIFFSLLGASGQHHQVLGEGLERWVGFFFLQIFVCNTFITYGFQTFASPSFPCEKVGGAFFKI